MSVSSAAFSLEKGIALLARFCAPAILNEFPFLSATVFCQPRHSLVRLCIHAQTLSMYNALNPAV
ncbi:hypothetical protein CLDAP_19930 [Caldilinea aerophila DSM 14535 = NBRC 104270]|uniref:Uncharacterized protein n=1 Tax=Caldilinea aerophila (strain DSM 14535 / JCM 11387 / NBRC 104270 / STL-6-O1) TaxID=926550 RepID=I0I445_CALAS|nr:hypothetical protein CLDAP_19930 [Caldilinea aerophila DSM 14535 = NBRC 104270]